MAGKNQWTLGAASAAGGTAITTSPCILGGFGVTNFEQTTSDVKLTDSLGGTIKLRYGVNGLTTIASSHWVDLKHPVNFPNGLTVSLGAGTTTGRARVSVEYKLI